MPTATKPLGKPSATKPTTGFTKPAAPGRQASASTAKDTDSADDAEEETTGLQPIHLGISIVALIIAALFAFTTYKGDQTPNRNKDAYLFGEVKTSDDSASGGYADTSDDDDADDSGSSSSSSGDDDEDGDEEEDDDE